MFVISVNSPHADNIQTVSVRSDQSNLLFISFQRKNIIIFKKNHRTVGGFTGSTDFFRTADNGITFFYTTSIVWVFEKSKFIFQRKDSITGSINLCLINFVTGNKIRKIICIARCLHINIYSCIYCKFCSFSIISSNSVSL